MKRIWLYRCAVFLSGFLLFQIELMISKAMLPRFGGSYLVWTSSMVFFQAMLLFGYLYVHSVQRWFGVFRYTRWHVIMLLLPFIVFPYRFDQLLAFSSKLPLAFTVPYLLLIHVGFPFFLLSTASIILQSWFYISDIPERDNPYVLYSASNFGSMVGLLTYPVLFEPIFNLTQQGYLWWAGYSVFVMLHILCMPRSTNRENPMITAFFWDKKNAYRIFTWFILSLAGSFTLLAVTNVITFDIASVSFLWAIPLSVYLATFILTFKRNPWYPLWTKTILSSVILFGVILYLASLLHMGFPVLVSLLLQLGILFIVCLNCHGCLVQNKPSDIQSITVFYLAIATGGFAGSLLVGMLLPCISTSLIEYPSSFFLALCAIAIATQHNKMRVFLKNSLVAVCCSIIVIIALTAIPWTTHHFFGFSAKINFVIVSFIVLIALHITSKEILSMACVLLILTICSQWTEEFSYGAERAKRLRNFYGVYLVYDTKGQRYLQHGTTLHGRQYLSGAKRKIPISYFHHTTPIGQLLSANPFQFRSIGMIGLGAGTLAAYVDSAQTLTIYELDPDSLKVAERYFSYLRFAREKGVHIKVVFGDGRISLRNPADRSLDLLIIDAFNSDSVPIHLMTQEAIGEYFRVLAHDGLLLMHISSRIFDLSKVLFAAAQKLELYACIKTNFEHIDPDAEPTIWMAFCRDRRRYDVLVNKYNWEAFQPGVQKKTSPWTDRYSNLFQALR